ncbi:MULTISPECIES: F0F1 ATP synthase subunit epsilon [Phyllobacterium]|jgi:F-type H+-transporting ATPase subunit epsilon|uniref:ATP synthase epsilon chain n=1 Tax=Phyllobacterium trifolii TaxID=300193 RepID=A0A839U6Y4_9HYPH|nr:MULTISPECIES: F0F1 ATP synthase subunit epsilon [Phyllobacterium]MBB3145744.1 F-type H+-transporting ATPase subunit epsilon [Phyllobacterium trifolii]MBZ9602074.1 F0F1 ATP synthase subunit epsilon [Phyllobacterium sp. KW56]MDR6631604.1 F-type H+-transporting ATPase subunit epsilon [Phyllobacterium sp. 1468]
MAEAFQFELVSPERLLLSEQIIEVVVPGTEGYMTVMAHHAPLMATVKPGVVAVKTPDGKLDSYVVFGGFVDITPDGCTLLAESAVHVADIRADELQNRIKDAQEDFEDATTREDRAKAEDLLGQLKTLEEAIKAA